MRWVGESGSATGDGHRGPQPAEETPRRKRLTPTLGPQRTTGRRWSLTGNRRTKIDDVGRGSPTPSAEAGTLQRVAVLGGPQREAPGEAGTGSRRGGEEQGEAGTEARRGDEAAGGPATRRGPGSGGGGGLQGPGGGTRSALWRPPWQPPTPDSLPGAVGAAARDAERLSRRAVVCSVRLAAPAADGAARTAGPGLMPEPPAVATLLWRRHEGPDLDGHVAAEEPFREVETPETQADQGVRAGSLGSHPGHFGDPLRGEFLEDVLLGHRP